MRHISHKKKTKRGNDYNVRSTRAATGYSKVLADRRSGDTHLGSEKYGDLLKLAVKGTLDSLGSNMVTSISRLVNREHPTDKEYTRKAYIISDYGRKKLERYRRNL